MRELQIECITHDTNQVITHVGISGKKYDIQTAVDWIRTRVHPLYTYKNNRKAKVYAKQHQTSGKWFLTTNPDDTRMNNLDFLPYCNI